MSQRHPLRLILLALSALVPLAGAPPQLFQWKSVNIQGMGYVTGLVATARPDGSGDVYIRTDVGGAYRYSASKDQWIPLLDTSTRPGGIGVESIATEARSPQRVYVALDWPVPGTFLGGNGIQQFNTSGEVLVSEDRGASWRPTGLISQGVVTGANGNYRVESGERLAADPNIPGVVYFATRANGVWKGVRGWRSANSTYTWTQVQGGLPAPASLNESSQGGAGNQPGFTFALFDKSSAAFDAVSGFAYTQTIYVGAHSSGVWRSRDGGASWSLLAGGPADPVRGTVAADGTLYVSCGGIAPNGTVWKYAQGAWTIISPAASGGTFTGITSDPGNPAIVMVGRDNMVYRSVNGGAAWSSQQMLMQGVDPLAPGTNSSAPRYYKATAGASGGVAARGIDPVNPKHVWWTNGWGAARTDDITAAAPFWAWHMQNLEELVSVMLRVPPKPKSAGGADLVSMAMDMIGFRHQDKDQVPATKISPAGVPLDLGPGLAWQASYGTTYPVPWPHVSMGNSLDFCYTKPDNLAYIGWGEWQAWSNYGASSDNGQTWTAFPSIPSEPLWSGSTQQTALPIAGQLAMSATDPQNMVWAPAWGSFDGTFGTASAANAPWPHFTTDGGKTWQLCKLANPPAKPSPYDAHNNDQVHYDALPRNWPNAPSPYVTNYALAADRADPAGKTFYYLFQADYSHASHSVFYTSTDGGATWSAGATDGFPGGLVHPGLVVNPLSQGDVWAVFKRNETDVTANPVYRSTDGGKTFKPVATVDSAEALGFGAGVSAGVPFIFLYGRVGGAAIDAMYKSEDLGQSWMRINDPAIDALPGVNFIEGDMRTPNLVYVALLGRGIKYGQLPLASSAPAIASGGVVNAASLTQPVARGSIAAMQGARLASQTSAAVGTPLPAALAGTRVTVDSVAAPILFVSPSLVFFQMPWETATSANATVAVHSDGVPGPTVDVPLAPDAVGVFGERQWNGSTLPLVVHAGSGALVSTANPGSSSEALVAWVTGLADVATAPPDGVPAASDTAVSPLPTGTLGGSPVTVQSADLPAGSVGVARIKFRLPASAPATSPQPLIFTAGGVASPAVDLAVR